jgi:hypothetical protein
LACFSFFSLPALKHEYKMSRFLVREALIVFRIAYIVSFDQAQDRSRVWIPHSLGHAHLWRCHDNDKRTIQRSFALRGVSHF